MTSFLETHASWLASEDPDPMENDMEHIGPCTLDSLEVNNPRVVELEKTIQEIRESQLRTEKLVTDFIESAMQHPMFKMMGKQFGL